MLNNEHAYKSACKFDLFLNHAIELIGIHFADLPLHGLAKEAEASQEESQPELVELSIKYSDFFAMSAETRYLLKFMQRVQYVLSLKTQRRSDFNTEGYDDL